MTKTTISGPYFRTPSAVANFFLDKGKKEKIALTPMKLIKLAYIAYGWALGTENILLFAEDIEAWRYGPVIPSLYHEFKHFGGNPIVDCYSLEYDAFESIKPYIPRVDEERDLHVIKILNLVWRFYKNRSATDLMMLTHQEGTPWFKVWEKAPDQNATISREDIHAHYTAIINDLLEEDMKYAA